MCGICGVIGDGRLASEEKEEFFRLLMVNERRGTDATGIYYGFGSERLVKLPVRARYFVSELKELLLNDMLGVSAVLGHTRAATRGSPKFNENNHPFKIKNFVFAHNGVAYDCDVEFGWRGFRGFKDYKELPKFANDEIVTDSYRNLFVPIVEQLVKKKRIDVEDVKEAIESVVSSNYIVGAFWLADSDSRLVYVVNVDGDLTYKEKSGTFLFSSIGLENVLDDGKMIVVDENCEVEIVKLNVRGMIRRRRVREVRKVRGRWNEDEIDEWGWYGW